MSRAPQPATESALVCRATSQQIPELARMLARAFEHDPVYEWLIPEGAQRATRLRWMFELQLNRFSVELRDTYTTARLDACAIWKPAGDYSMSLGEQLQVLPAFARILGWRRIPRSMKLMDHMEALHARLAPGPHVYLNVLGVEPSQRGRGTGQRLLEPMLERCDAEGRDVYLETANVANVPFYERNAFELREVAEHPRFPTFWAMFRPARSRA
jgi:ribosomal protein S18 acetylase RimI-like enzyme